MTSESDARAESLAKSLLAATSPDPLAVAAERIEGRVWRTPALRCDFIDELCGARVWLKCENLQRIGAFKARGAMHAVGRLEDADRTRGVITYSSGNHAQAVALAAREFGVPAHIAMPVDAPPIKKSVVEKLGAEVVLAGTTSEHRRVAALEIQARTNGTIIPPFDDADIVCGQGTATMELCQDVRRATGRDLDALFVPVGGGGVIAGACVAMRHQAGEIFAVEPHGCDAMSQSLEAGKRVAVEPGPTLADGLKPVMVGALNFSLARRRVRAGVRVDDQEMGEALVRLLVRAKLVVEPSGAAGLAAALREIPKRKAEELPSEDVGVILTGGNVEPSLVATLLERHAGQV